jgi:hypothetical protein
MRSTIQKQLAAYNAIRGTSVILADNETKVDLLNYEAIAETIATVLRDKPDRPITIGVHGDWGAGKSSVLEMIEARLEKDEKALCLKFNGWRFQGFEDAKIALIEGVVTGLLEKRPKLTKTSAAVKDVFRSIDWLKVARKAGGLAITAYTGIPMPDQIQSIVAGAEMILADPKKLLTKENFEGTIEGVKGLLKPDSGSKNVPEEIGEFRKAFDKLLSDADIDQLIVLIDDLDRCLPETAIETLEAIRHFVFMQRTAFVIAADEAMIEYAVRRHFPELPDTTGPQSYSRNYLEKLIQVPFRIPALGDIETRIYVSLLMVGTRLPDGDGDFEKLIGVARERLKRPWTSAPFEIATIKTTLGTKFERARDAFLLSEQVGPMLAAGTRGNPRQIKRFLNTLVLRYRMAEARGFADEVKLPVLAKLMLAERFMPRLFDQIASAASASPEGKCADLLALERAKTEITETEDATGGVAAGPRSSGGAKAALAPDSAQLTEWLSSPQTRAWANIEPSIGDRDLRAYLFVAKDRRDYFGAASVLGHLSSVAEKLLGPKLAVQAMEPNLRQLAPLEAGEIFEIVRRKIISADEYVKEPEGIAGLVVLVKAHPSLQASMLDLLESIPHDRVGPWVCVGWESALRDDDAKTRFDVLLDLLAKKGMAMTKTSAAAALRMRRKEK